MSCTVAISNSPVFSPRSRVSSSLFCKTASSSSSSTSSPESLKNHPSSPSSPLRVLRLQKPPPSPSGLIRTSVDCSSSVSGPGLALDLNSPSISKRKRPARLDIPVVSLGSGNIPVTPSAAAAARSEWDVVEVEGDAYGVYCKKGRREAMEDRYSAAVNLQGDPKQVQPLKKLGFFIADIS